jgi:two-component system response regulator HupR/HoxA
MNALEWLKEEKAETVRQATVLVVDDEVRSLEALTRVLGEEFEVISARNAAEAEAVLAGDMVQVILCDQRMPGERGVDFLKRVRDLWPCVIRMIISGYTDSEDIIAGVNEAGIYRYVTKPWQPEELMTAVREAAELYHYQKITERTEAQAKPSHARINREVRERARQGKKLFDFSRIIHTADSPMRHTLTLASRAADYGISVLITGSSGTGKELLARAIHHGSARAAQPFVVENCGALPDELLESELFGYKRGAFTGAYQDRIGLFEVADGGTIFLDEIGETSPSFQVKLLRVLQEGEIRPLGAQRPRKINVRVISATNRDLEAEVRAGRFRRDLYYRLAVFPIHLPSLAERSMDIPAIAAQILLEVNQSFGRQIPGFASETLKLMMAYDWPGNVRELQNEIQRLVTLTDDDGELAPHLLASAIRNGAARDTAGRAGPGAATSLKDRVEALESTIITEALERLGGNISRVAAELGLSRVGLRNKIDRYGLTRTVDSDGLDFEPADGHDG